MKICTGVEVQDEIVDIKFNLKSLMDFDVIAGQNSAFPIDFVRGP